MNRPQLILGYEFLGRPISLEMVVSYRPMLHIAGSQNGIKNVG